ncbi:MAG: hypothetical protein JWQ63_4314 [Mucilaginibacter sp.]|nr:hypothetical protein [Mucilaginibacter sp.]
MKTAIFSLLAILLLVILTLVVLPGCNKSSVSPATNNPISNKSTSLAGKAATDTVPTGKPPVKYTTTPLTGDQITLVPHFYKSPTADSSYVYFIAQTKNYYCGISLLHTSYNFANGNYTIGFLDVVQPSPCVIGDGPIAATINLTQNGGPMPVGTFPITVTLNGTTYAGSMVSSSTSITFNWNYTSGVLIAPQQISR